MPKIKKIEVRKDGTHINSSRGFILFETAINYANKAFTINFPKEWDIMLEEFKEAKKVEYVWQRGNSSHKFSGGNEEAVEKLFFECAQQFYNSQKKEEKVILYHYAYSTKNTFSNHHKAVMTWNWETKKSDGDIRIQVDYRVLNKVTIGKSVEYFEGKQSFKKATNELSENKIAGGDEEWIEIPHTDEAEDFFKSVYNGFEILVKKITQYLGTKDTVNKTIDSKIKLLK
jgi:hypothetical protein